MKTHSLIIEKFQQHKITNDPDMIAAMELRRRLWTYDELNYLYRRQLANPPYYIRKNHKDLEVPEPVEPAIKGIDVMNLRKRIDIGKMRIAREKRERI